MDKSITLGTRLKMAGKSLAGLNFGSAFTALAAPSPFLLDPSTYGSGAGSNFFMNFNTGQEVWFSWSDHRSGVKAYTTCAPVNAVINKKTQAHLTGKQSVVNTSGKGKGKEATGEAATKLKALLERPNYLQSWNEFEAQMKIYQQVFGYCILLPVKPVGFPAIYASSVWVIPPYMCNIIEKPGIWFADESASTHIQSITLTYGSQITQLDPDAVFIIKDITPSFNTVIIPDSRLKALSPQINNTLGAYNARGGLIDDRGALGIISSDKSDDSGKIPWTKTEKEDIQRDLGLYGIKKGQIKYIMTNASLKWTSVGFATKELMLFEEIEDDIMRICDAYGVNFRLLSNTRNSSLGGSDAAEFDKQFYQNTIIPESDTLYDQLNQFFGTKAYNIRLVNDFSHLTVLQADAVKTAQASMMLSRGLQMDFLCNVITLNEWRVAKGWEVIPDGDKYYSDIKDLIGTPTVHAGQATESLTTTDPTTGKILNLLQ